MATEEAVEPDSSAPRRRRRGRGGTPPAEPVNAPLTFIEFVSDHRLGSEVQGEVERFSSHGAFVKVGDAACYIPLSAMGDPPPRAAREVLTRGETRPFVVQALDPPRRGIELALPGFAHVAAAPTEETVEEEIAAGHEAEPARAPRPVKKVVKKKATAKKKAAAPAKKVAAKKVPAKKAAAPVKKAAVKKAAAPVKKKAAAPVKKKAAAPVAKKAAPAKKKAAAPVRQAAPKKAAPATKKAAVPVKKAPAKRTKKI
jgi:hypothetical protein